MKLTNSLTRIQHAASLGQEKAHQEIMAGFGRLSEGLQLEGISDELANDGDFVVLAFVGRHATHDADHRMENPNCTGSYRKPRKGNRDGENHDADRPTKGHASMAPNKRLVIRSEEENERHNERQNDRQEPNEACTRICARNGVCRRCILRRSRCGWSSRCLRGLRCRSWFWRGSRFRSGIWSWRRFRHLPLRRFSGSFRRSILQKST